LLDALPPSSSVMSVVFPKIIRYIKDLDSINFYKGLLNAEKYKTPVRILKLESYVNSRYKKEIEKIKSICMTAENFIFDLLCK
jgi:hypothetical protein